MSKDLMPQIRPPVKRTIHTLSAHLQERAGVEQSEDYIDPCIVKCGGDTNCLQSCWGDWWNRW